MRQRVLPEIGVEHQQRLVRRGRVGFLDDAADLGDFFHQMQLGRQAAGGVGQHDVDAACARGGDGVEDDRRRVARLLRDHRHLVAFAPRLQLFARRRAESVAGGQQHRQALGVKVLGQLADRRRFAGAVDARDHDDIRALRRDFERFLERLQQFVQRVSECTLDPLWRVDLVALGARLEFGEQVRRRLQPDVAGQQ